MDGRLAFHHQYRRREFKCSCRGSFRAIGLSSPAGSAIISSGALAGALHLERPDLKLTWNRPIGVKTVENTGKLRILGDRPDDRAHPADACRTRTGGYPR